DAMAIFVALRSPEVEVIGPPLFMAMSTYFGHEDALHCFKMLLFKGVRTIRFMAGIESDYVVSLVYTHRTLSFLNLNFSFCRNGCGKPIDMSATHFLVEQAKLYPGKVTVVALGPLTNIALAIQQDPSFVKTLGKLFFLVVAFAVNGNVNPAAEANMLQILCSQWSRCFGCRDKCTHQVILTDSDRETLASSKGKFAQYLLKILEVYFNYHHDAYSTKGVYLHDPTAMLAAINPSLITYVEGAVRVQTNGITRGLTLLYNKQKRFAEITKWSDQPSVKVAVTVDAPAVLKLVLERLME
ncbi:hypothetical protein ERO13_D04G136250v2, partial [Gossypium hirsutum]